MTYIISISCWTFSYIEVKQLNLIFFLLFWRHFYLMDGSCHGIIVSASLGKSILLHSRIISYIGQGFFPINLVGEVGSSGWPSEQEAIKTISRLAGNKIISQSRAKLIPHDNRLIYHTKFNLLMFITFEWRQNQIYWYNRYKMMALIDCDERTISNKEQNGHIQFFLIADFKVFLLFTWSYFNLMFSSIFKKREI